MLFGGYQKLTLLDFPGVVACTLFTRGCNFRCPFCHNAPLVERLEEADSVSDEEILAFLQKRQGILEGVCITGGEPLLHPELGGFIRKARALGYRIKLDTNGSYPERLRALVEEGLLDYVAMDIKNTPDKYPATAGVPQLDMAAIEASIDYLMEGHVPYEFRTTVARELHTVADIAGIASRIRGAEAYFIQNFKDSGAILSGGLSAVEADVLADMQAAGAVYVPGCRHR